MDAGGGIGLVGGVPGVGVEPTWPEDPHHGMQAPLRVPGVLLVYLDRATLAPDIGVQWMDNASLSGASRVSGTVARCTPLTPQRKADESAVTA